MARINLYAQSYHICVNGARDTYHITTSNDVCTIQAIQLICKSSWSVRDRTLVVIITIVTLDNKIIVVIALAAILHYELTLHLCVNNREVLCISVECRVVSNIKWSAIGYIDSLAGRSNSCILTELQQATVSANCARNIQNCTNCRDSCAIAQIGQDAATAIVGHYKALRACCYNPSTLDVVVASCLNRSDTALYYLATGVLEDGSSCSSCRSVREALHRCRLACSEGHYNATSCCSCRNGNGNISVALTQLWRYGYTINIAGSNPRCIRCYAKSFGVAIQRNSSLCWRNCNLGRRGSVLASTTLRSTTNAKEHCCSGHKRKKSSCFHNCLFLGLIS